MTAKHVGRRRLLKLAEHLEKKVACDEFHMDVWDCGTAACGMGHACRIPSFRRAGLKLSYGLDRFLPKFKGHFGLAAAIAFFGISFRQAKFLFLPDGYPNPNVTPKKVAARIRGVAASL